MRTLLCAVFLALTSALPALGVAAPADGASSDPSRSRLGPAITTLALDRPDEPVAVWVFFADRAGGERDPSVVAEARRRLSPRSLERRARRGGLDQILTSDLPVHEPYVRALVARGARLRGVSRWLNAASVEIPAREATELAGLPFVSRIERVPSGHRPTPIGGLEEVPAGTPRSGSASPEATAVDPTPGTQAYYGGSYRQLNMMQVPQLHALGLSGAGVLVCMLDTGYHLTHRAYTGLDVVATRDFINGDANVDYQAGQDALNQPFHGTQTLACVAGSWPGMYSGPAFGASVALAKTENLASETPAEMDFWQFAAEWADSLGADVISASLGYTTFNNPGDSYSYADMDGRTTAVTLAAVEAARRGITVVTAAGNEGNNAWHFIVAPGDADTVITVGAVDSSNNVSGFSSRGPTADGRIKPDLTAMGSSTLSISTGNDTVLVPVSGTSFATPLTAGVVALLLESHPTWGPHQVREALRETALNHLSPNNNIGWGLVQALAANNWVQSTLGVDPGTVAGAGLELSAGPNPLRPGAGTMIRFAAPAASRVRLEVLDLGGRRRALLHDGEAGAPGALRWSGAGEDGSMLPAGIYWIRITSFAAGGQTSRSLRVAVLR